ncbi:hypothetical protein [Streptomyces flaveus]|uniref:hypothetical protein n=1 Tax=Streptomyces flaveus TaxID=66370 RepID=UPI003323C4FB
MADRSTSLTPPGEKVDFDDEVDFFGDPGLDLEQLGFHVFQTRENVDDYGGPRDMPDIRFEIDPNLAARPNDNYSTMVWVPGAVPTANLNRWSPFNDATSTGDWYLTGSETNCTQANPCSSEELKDTLDDGGEAPSIYTAAVGKGRDHMWTGAVDDFRIDQHIYDFEADGVRARPAPRAN